jgi:hypothetical protein
MKRTFLSKLHRNGAYYLVGSLLLLLGVPLFQAQVLIPQGYSDAQAASQSGHFTTYLMWVGSHTGQFVVYRMLLTIAFAFLFSLPFTLFRIIVAQEILEPEGEAEDSQQEVEEEEKEEKSEAERAGALPTDAWRGKGYAVIAAWSGLFGIILYALGTLTGTIYIVGITSGLLTPDGFPTLTSAFNIITNTVGGGLLALACLFFGAVILRRGLNLWPGIWVAFGFLALALAVLFSGSAVTTASTPTGGQAGLTTVAILGFAIWVLWFGVMLVRLKPE